jgi:hypothetical protein
VNLVLGPGRAALLEIRYMNPADPIQAGDLRCNNQRKFLWDGRRYHCCFHTIDSTGASSIIYMRSLPVWRDSVDAIAPGQIRWEPFGYLIATDDYDHIEHRFPAMTLRVRGTDTVCTIVWTAVGDYPDFFTREVLLRNIQVASMGNASMSTIEHVDWYRGLDPAQWGTAVVSSLAGGEVIAWSDSAQTGVQARFRPLDSVAINAARPWWVDPVGYSNPTNVFGVGQTAPGKYPTVPTFTHISAWDSTCGIAWQQPTNSGTGTSIWYARLGHSTVPSLGLLLSNNTFAVSDGSGLNFHPSIDQTQDVWQNIQEGITWESVESGIKDNIQLNFATMYTPFDTIRTRLLPTQQWNRMKKSMQIVIPGHTVTMPTCYPNTASLNGHYDSTSQNELIQFSVAWRNPYTGLMKQLKTRYAESFIFPTPYNYVFGGWYPNSSANRVVRAGWLPPDSVTAAGDTIHNLPQWRAETWTREPIRPGVIYQSYEHGDSVFRTSKQFLAKSRPSGYLATGREVCLRIDDSLCTGISIRLHDVWISTDSSARPAEMIRRDSALGRTNSLWQVERLLRTSSFQCSDSTQIGFELFGIFYGDSLAAGNAQVTAIVELVDSSSGSVIARLDSFTISSAARQYQAELAPIVDLLSGVYYVRLRVVPSSMPAVGTLPYSNYPVTEVFSDVDAEHLSKLTRHTDAGTAKTRITAQPNPFGTTTGIRFSIPRRDYASVTVYDKLGHEVAQPLARTDMEAGRYALDFDGSALPPGTYLVELRTSRERRVEKMALVR